MAMDVLKMCICVWILGVSSGFATWLKLRWGAQAHYGERWEPTKLKLLYEQHTVYRQIICTTDIQTDRSYKQQINRQIIWTTDIQTDRLYKQHIYSQITWTKDRLNIQQIYRQIIRTTYIQTDRYYIYNKYTDRQIIWTKDRLNTTDIQTDYTYNVYRQTYYTNDIWIYWQTERTIDTQIKWLINTGRQIIRTIDDRLQKIWIIICYWPIMQITDRQNNKLYEQENYSVPFSTSFCNRSI